MDLQTPLVSGVLLALFTGIQFWINKGRFDALERRIDQLSSDVGQLRTDLLQVALALSQRPHPQAG